MTIGFTHYPTGEEVGNALADDHVEAVYAFRAFGDALGKRDEDEFVEELAGHDIDPIVRLRDLLTRAIDKAR
jgi:hypothetical protein